MKKWGLIAGALVSSVLGVNTALADIVTPMGYYKYNCSTSSTVCQAVQLSSYGTPQVDSNYIYVPTSGKRVLVEVDAFSNSMIQVGAYALNSSGKAVSEGLVATKDGGNDWVYIFPAAGNYKVRIICGDSSTKERCTGEARISYQK